MRRFGVAPLLLFVRSVVLAHEQMPEGAFSDKYFSEGHAQPRALPVAPLRSHAPNWKLGVLAHRRAAVGSGFSVPRKIAPKVTPGICSNQVFLVCFGKSSTVNEIGEGVTLEVNRG